MGKKAVILAGGLAVVAVLAAWLLGGASDLQEVNRRQVGIMDTVVNIRVYTPERGEGEAAAQEVLSLMEELEEEFSRHIPGSYVDRINANAGRNAVPVSKHLLEVMGRALELGEATGGAFDITVAPLMDLWGFGTPGAKVPSPEEILQRLPDVDYSAVQVDPKAGTVYLPREGMALDLGGVAKGYIVDRGIALLEDMGIPGAYLDAGGDIRVLGSKSDGTPWRIGIRNPRKLSEIFAVLNLDSDLAVVTSGDYQRYFDEGGIRHHHILDPETGYPAGKGAASVTVVAPDAMTADILSTAFFVMEIGESLDLAERMPGIEVFIITTDLGLFMSPGLEDRIELR